MPSVYAEKYICIFPWRSSNGEWLSLQCRQHSMFDFSIGTGIEKSHCNVILNRCTKPSVPSKTTHPLCHRTRHPDKEFTFSVCNFLPIKKKFGCGKKMNGEHCSSEYKQLELTNSLSPNTRQPSIYAFCLYV